MAGPFGGLVGTLSVAEQITSLVKTATLASKSDLWRMQYWQAIRAEYLIQIANRPFGRIS